MNANRRQWNFEKLVGSIRQVHEELTAQAGRAVNLGPQIAQTVPAQTRHLLPASIGILLCTQRDPTLVEYALAGMDNGLFFSKYQLELKSVEATAKVHRKQVLTYLKLTGLKLGYLLNFGENLMKDGIYRLINGTLE